MSPPRAGTAGIIVVAAGRTMRAAMIAISMEEAAVSDTDPRAEDWPETEVEAADEEWAGAEPGLETSEADAIEQRATVGPHAHDLAGNVPDEADEADATEQRRDIGLDDDDYR